MTTARTALVIGAGIAGPVAATALRKAGIQATVYEAHPSSAQGIGTFLTIASNGIDALRAVGADGPALAAGFPTPTIVLRGTTGKSPGGARTGLALPDGTTSHTLKRADLYQTRRPAARCGGSPTSPAATSPRGAKSRRSHRPNGNPAWPDCTPPTPAPRPSWYTPPAPPTS